MHREAQMVGFIHRHMEDMLCAHGNTTKYVVRFAHGDKIVATILSRDKDNVCAIESLLRLGNQREADMRRIRCNNNRLAHTDRMRKTIVIASDAPHISHALISQAQEALDGADVVLGPAEDGGYYLIAMRKPHDVFSGIPMSTQHVLHMTVDKAHHLGLSVHLLEPLFDIDEFPDLFRLAHILQKEQPLAPATPACLAKFISPKFMERLI